MPFVYEINFGNATKVCELYNKIKNPDEDIGVFFATFESQGTIGSSYLMECSVDDYLRKASIHLSLADQEEIFDKFDQIDMAVFGVQNIAQEMCKNLEIKESLRYSLTF